MSVDYDNLMYVVTALDYEDNDTVVLGVHSNMRGATSAVREFRKIFCNGFLRYDISEMVVDKV